MIFNSILYSPHLRTKDSEIEALRNIPDMYKDRMLPIFELTKSRVTKSKNPGGSVFKRIEDIKEVLPDSPFILDLTTNEDYSNGQIDEMIDLYHNGYSHWTSFVEDIQKKYGFTKLIPVVNYAVSGDEQNLKDQILRLRDLCGFYAFRIDLEDLESGDYYEKVYANSPTPVSEMVLVIDLGFVKYTDVGSVVDRLYQVLERKVSMRMPYKLIVLSSGFPKTVRAKGYYEDEGCGAFPLAEVRVQRSIRSNSLYSRYKGCYVYGDYGSVNPEPSYGFSPATYWPRIEMPLSESLYYYRTQPVLVDSNKSKNKKKHDRESAFIKSASNIMKDKSFVDISIANSRAWGISRIDDCSNGNVFSTAPSKWASVRINIHIQRQILRILQNG